jgi:hypothetical protein
MMDIPGVNAARDQCRTAIDIAIPYAAGPFIIRLAGQDHLTA